MVDVLLAHSYFLKHDPKQTAKMQPYPPLATFYAASLLRSAGYSVAVFDAMLSDGEHEFEAALAQYQPRFVALIEDSFNFLVKMCLIRMREAAFRMIAAARAAHATVIASGPDVSDHPDRLFHARPAIRSHRRGRPNSGRVARCADRHKGAANKESEEYCRDSHAGPV